MKWPVSCTFTKKLVWDKSISNQEKKDLFKSFRIDQYRILRECEKISGVFEVKRIEKQNHPANGQFGLFARKKVSPHAWIIDYCGYVTRTPMDESDYVLKFIDDVSIDAFVIGNEARMINDFRGVADKPNAEFLLYYDQNTQSFRMGVFALQKEIRKNEEILVTYGKSFWKERGLI